MDQFPVSSDLTKNAIDAGLNSRWEEALKLNRQIIRLDPQNVDALNRLAHTFMETGKYNLAKKYYGNVIKIDPYNPIALKNLKIVKSFKPNGHVEAVQTNGMCILSPSLFLQEPGKTKIVNLLKVTEPQKLSKAYCGMKVNMIIKNKKITIVDGNTNYLGVLPDDICHLLLRLLRGGNKYDLIIKSIRVNALSVIIKEVYRSRRFKNQSSFLENSEAGKMSEIFTSLDNKNESDEEPSESEEEQTG